MAIPSQFIDELTRRCDIVDVVGGYVSLNRKGGNLWGLCPFHGERTPSFSVSPDKQMYYCFGCHKGGGVINFIMEMESLPYVEAIHHLAKSVGLEVPEDRDNGAYRKFRERQLALNGETARFFYANLHAPHGERAREYIFRERRLSTKIATSFGLGYAPDGWDNLLTAMTEKGYSKEELLKAGLVTDGKNGRIYDRFRGRVMFPIINLRKEVIGFGGRILGEGEPKYLNTPETSIFHKGQNLFALNLAKGSKQGRIILTEGYMDTIALHQAGFDCAVASLGTALTSDHAKLLARYTKEVVIAFDSDAAGIQAANRSIPILEPTGIKVQVLTVQGAKDPDSYIQQYGKEAFAKLLDQSQSQLDYRIGQIQNRYNLSDSNQRVEFLREAVPFLATLPSPVEREVYGGRCASLAQVSPDAVAEEVRRAVASRQKKTVREVEKKNLTPAVQLQPKERALRYDNLRSGRAEEGIIRLVLLDATLFEKLTGLSGEDFTVPLFGKAFSHLKCQWQEGGGVNLSTLTPHLNAQEMNHLSGVVQQPESLDQSQRALEDYMGILSSERELTHPTQDLDPLLVLQQKKRGKT